MANHSRTTFKKRQKELIRMEKQRDKAAKRMQRKQERGTLSLDAALDPALDSGQTEDQVTVTESTTPPAN